MPFLVFPWEQTRNTHIKVTKRFISPTKTQVFEHTNCLQLALKITPKESMTPVRRFQKNGEIMIKDIFSLNEESPRKTAYKNWVFQTMEKN